MSIELPKMPEPKLYQAGTYPDGVLTYTADQMTAYAQEAARLALEAAAQKVLDMCAWTGGHGEPSRPSYREIAEAIRSMKDNT